MEIEFTNQKNDYLIFQLWQVSKSQRTKNRRIRNRFAIPVILIVIGIQAAILNYTLYFILSVTTSLAWFILYPYYFRWLYINHYSRHIDEYYKNIVNKTGRIKITDEYLESNDEGGSSKILLPEIKFIEEIGSHFFVQLKSGLTLILPKDRIDSINDFIGLIENKTGLKKVKNLDWKWK